MSKGRVGFDRDNIKGLKLKIEKHLTVFFIFYNGILFHFLTWNRLIFYYILNKITVNYVIENQKYNKKLSLEKKDC